MPSAEWWHHGWHSPELCGTCAGLQGWAEAEEGGSLVSPQVTPFQEWFPLPQAPVLASSESRLSFLGLFCSGARQEPGSWCLQDELVLLKAYRGLGWFSDAAESSRPRRAALACQPSLRCSGNSPSGPSSQELLLPKYLQSRPSSASARR